MHLPTPQFSRLVTVLAFDLTNPALDSMILAWDHIASRYLRRLAADGVVTAKVESIRLLAIHDAVHAVFASGDGCLFNGGSAGYSLEAALAATAQASHDILAAIFERPDDRANLADELHESLALIADERERTGGATTGAASAATYIRILAPLARAREIAVDGEAERRHFHAGRHAESARHGLRLAKNPHWIFDWKRSA